MTKAIASLQMINSFCFFNSAFSAWSVYSLGISMSKLAPVYKSGEDCSVERFKLYDMHFKMSVFVQKHSFYYLPHAI